jgi:hypothetical protein
MRAIIVSVEYGDLLSLTLPYNRHHFQEVMVVTTQRDEQTQAAAKACDAQLYITDAFYESGADFNKWVALERALDKFGRHGLMAFVDADIMWPKETNQTEFERGKLYTPRRRMWVNLTDYENCIDENTWRTVPLAYEVQYAGYTQIFHADDPRLPNPPWHELNWRHAGGADSGFQNLWPERDKVRPNWVVLHLGTAGMNWCGRSTPYLDGSLPREAEERKRRLWLFYNQRRYARNEEELYAAEKLPN